MDANFSKKIFLFLSSYGLATVVLIFLLILTFLGTLEQIDYGIYDVQKKYFESLFVIHHLGGPIYIPLPGAYLLLVLLFINLLCGALIKAQKNWRRPGMLIAHGGILFLLISGFVTFHFSTRGTMQLYEGESSATVQSYFDWVVEIAQVEEGKISQAYLISQRDFDFLRGEQKRVFYTEALPFDVHLTQYLRNCFPVPSADGKHRYVVDSYALRGMDLEKQAEQNIPGVYIEILPKSTDQRRRGILWGLEAAPLSFHLGGETWIFRLKRAEWELPFSVFLDQFTYAYYPGTNRPKYFRSDVTKQEGEHSEKMGIEMNEPLRSDGYTLYQAKWGPTNALPGESVYSIFEVVSNPADQWPLYACIVVSVGLVIHFIQKLLPYLRKVRRKT